MRESVAAPGSFVEQSVFDALVEELEHLRREVVLLRQAQERAGVTLDFSDPLESVKYMDRLQGQFQFAGDREVLQDLIQHRLNFLERFSDHEKAESQLLHLVSNCISSGETDAGLDYLSLFSDRVGMSHAVELGERAALLLNGDRYSEAKATWADLSNDGSLPEHVQADGAFWAAYTEMRHGDPEVAKKAFEQLIARFEGSEDWQIVSTVKGAKTQLESLP